MAVKHDIYTIVTNQIIEQLEEGTRPWLQPWSTSQLEGNITMPKRHNGENYNGLNILLLWCALMRKSYTSNQWMTYKQATELGGHVIKGEKGQQVVYANKLTRTAEDSDGKEYEQVIPYMKTYNVFNVEQIKDLPERFYNKPVPINENMMKDEQLERFFSGTGAEIRHGGGAAYYNQHNDYINMPYIECFEEVESYYATLSHELTHWTKHESRINRDFGGAQTHHDRSK